MKIQILVDDQIINTQLISVESLGQMPAHNVLKLMALRAALDDRAISISQSLRASFRLFDVTGQPIEDEVLAGRR